MFKIRFLFFTLISKSLFSQEKGVDEIINEAFQPVSSFWESLIFHEFFGTGMKYAKDFEKKFFSENTNTCLLYTSDAADDQ